MNKPPKVSKPLLTEFSFSELLFVNLMRFGCVIGMGYLFTHYHENPPVIVIAMLLCFCLFMFIGEDVIRLYPDRLELQDGSLAGYFFSRTKIFWLKDVSQAYLPGVNTDKPGAYAAGMIAVLLAIVPSHRRRRRWPSKPIAPICLILKDGREEVLITRLNNQACQRLVHAVKELLANKTSL